MVINARTQEIYDDIIEISDILLDQLKDKAYQATNDTAHGRIMNQLLWFKQKINNETLKLPLDKNDRSSLSYIYTNDNIDDIVNSKLSLGKLLVLTDNYRILKPIHFPKVIEFINDLLTILSKPPRILTGDERKFISEIRDLIPKLEKKEITPRKDFTIDTYPGLWFIYADWEGSSLDDIPKSSNLVKIIHEGMVNGKCIYLDSYN